MRTHQRNLFRYFTRHQDSCKVPSHRAFGVHLNEHINAVDALEQMHLITVTRPSTNYLMWTVHLTDTAA